MRTQALHGFQLVGAEHDNLAAASQFLDSDCAGSAMSRHPVPENDRQSRINSGLCIRPRQAAPSAACLWSKTTWPRAGHHAGRRDEEVRRSSRWLFFAQPTKLSHHDQVFRAAKVRVQLRLFRHVTDPAFIRHKIVLDLPAVEQNLTGIYVNQPGDHLHGCGFARAIRTQIPGNFSRTRSEASHFQRQECLNTVCARYEAEHGIGSRGWPHDSICYETLCSIPTKVSASRYCGTPVN